MAQSIKIFTQTIDDASKNQLRTMIESPAFENAKIRVMPDVHAGKGSVVGLTVANHKHIIPAVIGVDIGCGVLAYDIGFGPIDLDRLESVIRKHIPHGHAVRDRETDFPNLRRIRVYTQLKDTSRILKGLGTLGGGNHFIEVGERADGRKYLIVHSGSRNLGHQIATIYQNKAIAYHARNTAEQDELIARYKAEGRQNEISDALFELSKQKPFIPHDLAYLSDEDKENYLHDMNIAQQYAQANRKQILDTIVSEMSQSRSLAKQMFVYDTIESVHNYYDFSDGVIRKGAISAHQGERVIIPLNMRDGCILGVGKGNSDWNNSAPHGAGRLMSRTEAKKKLKVEDFKSSMRHIYSTTVNENTIDESPKAYKSTIDIIELIRPTVDMKQIIYPIYNFKSDT